MSTSSSSPACASFDRFQVDLSSGELRKSGNPVPIQVQPLQVLRLLLEAGGNVVTREQLRAALWPGDSFVDFEHGVNTAVRKLRTALDDSAEHPRFIETLPKVGYRFTVPVEWVADNNGRNGLRRFGPVPIPKPPPTLPKLRWKLKAAAAIVTLAAIASLASLSEPNSRLAQTQLGSSLRRILVHQPPVFIERQLTANPEGMPVTSAVISPDGKYLAYTDRTGFYLRLLSSGETHPMPLPKGFEPVAESWFPDSVHMAVSWVEQANYQPSIWQVSLLGGTPRKLVDDGSSARVSPDGSKIAFVRGKSYSGELWVMQADGSNARKVAGGTQAEIEDGFSPGAWAPDGLRIAYVRSTPQVHERDETRIEIADVTSGHIQVALSSPGLAPALGWTQDNRLVYSLQESSPNHADFNLWCIQLDARTARPLGQGSRITHGQGRTAELSITIDGKLLALRRLNGQPDVYVAELTNGGKKMGAPERLTLDERTDVPLTWTPDSKAVIFESNRDGPFHIFEQAIDQIEPELLVGGNDISGPVRLTPDSTEMLYLSAKSDDPSHIIRIMRVSLAGGPQHFVLEGPWIWNLECARLPSSLCIYSTSGPDWVKFFTFDSVKGSGTEVAEWKVTSPGYISWSLSPDGKYLATAELGRITQPSIRIVSIDNKTKNLLLVPGWAEVGGISWAADAKSLWVGATRNSSSFGRLDTWGLLTIDLEGRIETVRENGTVRFWSAVPSPDGRRLALFGGTDPSNVWLLQNF